MSFELITSTERYLCLSTDVKPTVGIKKSALAKETDTGNEFIFNGIAWVAYSQPTTIVGSLANQRGLAVNKPLASAVDVGTTYWSVDTDPHADFIEVSDGTNWVVI